MKKTVRIAVTINEFELEDLPVVLEAIDTLLESYPEKAIHTSVQDSPSTMFQRPAQR